MTATRTRKKGCPFCKAKPSSSFFVWDRISKIGSISCLECGASGPEVSTHIQDKEALLAEAWSKWNGRG